MRTRIASLCLLVAAAVAVGQEKEAPKAALKAGDKAPAFKADQFFQGTEVKGLEAGKIYVVEFWATWCGPCIAMMPHLADLAEEYKAKGVTVIGFSSKAQDDAAKNKDFVQKRGPKLGYTFAWGDDDATHKAWMNAAQQNGIPCSFVVGKDGNIAFIGHPMFLDAVLPKVVDGTWDAAKGKEETDAFEKDFEKAYEAKTVEELEKLLAARPVLADNPYLLQPKLNLMVKAKKFAEAKAAAEKAVAKAEKRGDTNALRTVGTTLLSDDAKAEKGLVAVAVKAAEMDRAVTGKDDAGAAMRLATAYRAAGDEKAKAVATEAVELATKAVKGDKDWQGNLLLANAHDAAGDKTAAKAAAEKALAAASESKNPGLVNYVKEQTKKFGAEAPAKAEEKK